MSMTHWLVVAMVVLLLFGRGKISELMGDVAKGIKSFKKGMAEEDVPATEATVPPKPIEHRTTATVSPVVEQAEVRKS
jgi:sec-independent protein translocase protein TatA